MVHEIDMEMERLAETGSDFRSSFRLSSSFRSGASDLAAVSSFRGNNDDEVELQWAAIQRLPTFHRLRTSLFDQGLLISDSGKGGDDVKTDGKWKPIDVTEIGALERHLFMDKLITKIEEDNLRLLKKLRFKGK